MSIRVTQEAGEDADTAAPSSAFLASSRVVVLLLRDPRRHPLL